MSPRDYYQYLVETCEVAQYMLPYQSDTFPEELFIEAGFDEAEREAIRSATHDLETDPLLKRGGRPNLIL